MVAQQVLTASLRSTRYGVILVGVGLTSIWYLNAQPPPKLKHLNPSNFTPYTLVSKDDVSSTSSIFRLRPQNKDPATAQLVKKAFEGGIWSVQFKQPQLQIARNYTPIPDPDGTLDEDELQLLIRREEGGEVSNYLHDLPERSTLSIRGPFDEGRIPGDVTNVLFLAGGTGIAPALQVANMLKTRQGMKMHIFWANRRREDSSGGQSDLADVPSGIGSWISSAKSSFQRSHPPAVSGKSQTVQIIESLQSQCKTDQLNVHYYVDEEKKFVNPDDISRLLEHRPRGKGLVLVSGPDGFVEYWAGKREWAMGRQTQGTLGGQLAPMSRKGWTVIKI